MAETNQTASQNASKPVENNSADMPINNSPCVVVTGDAAAGVLAPIVISKPETGATNEVSVQPGQQYFFTFAEETPTSFIQKDGNLEVAFEDGSLIKLIGFGEATAGDLPASFSFSDAFSGESIVVAEEVVEVIETVPAEDALEEPQAEIRETVVEVIAEVEPEAVIVQQIAAFEPAAGEPNIADILAEIEPAAGETGGGSEGRGFGFQSSFSAAPVVPLQDVGPINPTALQFNIPDVNTDLLFIEDPAPPADDIPVIVDPAAKNIDETNLGPIVVNDTIVADFGNDGPGIFCVQTTGTNFTSSVATLTSGGVPVDVNAIDDQTFIGSAGGNEIFKLVVNQDGSYTFTQSGVLDHPDTTDPDDVIALNFGIIAKDSDDDTDTTILTINVADDGPAPNARDERTVDEDNLGPITINPQILVNYGQDGPGEINANDDFQATGSVKGNVLSSEGSPITVTLDGNGYKGVDADGNTIFTLEITDATTGAYAFTLLSTLDHADPNDPNDRISLEFGVNITDFDGDSAPGTIVINVDDSAPVFGGNAVKSVDEDNLNPATSVSDDIDVNFVGNVTLTPDGTNGFSGSAANGQLSSNGVPVAVNPTANGYEGVANGVTVFTLVIDSTNKTYTFTLNEPLDHADGTNPNDTIQLSFGVLATDGNGNTDSATIKVDVLDSAPFAVDDSAGTINDGDSASGNVITNDDEGEDVDATVTQVQFGTTTLAVPATGSVSIDGDFGTLTISADGSYTYASNEGVSGQQTDVFTYTLTDFDGDSDTATLTANIIDNDATVSISGLGAVDESDADFDNGIFTSVQDVATFDFGVDGPGTIVPTGANSFTATGSVDNNVLSFDGKAITVSLNGDTYTGTASDGTEVFTMQIGTDGNFEFILKQAIDHADDSDPNDIINLNFGVTISDVDGDSATGVITINVADDGPSFLPSAAPAPSPAAFAASISAAVAATGTAASLTDIDEAELENGDQSINGSLNVDFGNDAPGTILANDIVTFDGTLDDTQITSGGEVITVTSNAANDTYTGTTAGGEIAFTLVITDIAEGDYTFTQFLPLDHEGDVITLAFGVRATDRDGDFVDGSVQVTIADDVLKIGDSFGDVDESEFDVVDEISTSGVVTTDFGADLGSISFDVAQDPVVTVDGNPITLSSNGQQVLFNLTGGTIEGVLTPGGDPVLTITLEGGTGKYTYKQFTNFDHQDPNDPNDTIEISFAVIAQSVDGDEDTGTITISVADDAPEAFDDVNGAEEGQFITGSVVSNDDLSEDTPNSVTSVEFGGTTQTIPAGGSATITTSLGELVMNSDGTYTFTATDLGDPDGTDVFNYTLTDSEGDSDTATLSIRVTPDGAPVADEGEMTVDETDFKFPVLGEDTTTGKLNIDFGVDGPGKVSANGNIERIGGGTTLTSGGDEVEVRVTATGYEAVNTVTDEQVFVLTVENDGSYDFDLLATLDHADPTDPNDNIRFEFGFEVTDFDGDAVQTKIAINVRDDAPVALDDTTSATEGTPISGNVTNNDIGSEDAPNTVVAISFNGTEVPVTAGGATILGQFGTLVIQQSGAYTYTPDNNNPDGVDEFTYTLEDSEGDQDTAEFAVTVSPIDDTPTPTAESKTIDEDNLGPITVDGKITADFGADAPGSFCVKTNGTNFTSSVGTLRSGGDTVLTSTVGDSTIIGTAGGVEIFRLVVDADGNYTFTQSGPLDHPDSSNPNDNIALNFQIIAKDADGDMSEATLTINVLDSGPVANDDINTANEGQTVTGNIIANDDQGEDTPASLFVVAGTPITADGTVINGQFGTLTINRNGSYSYKANADTPDGVDQFAYTISDFDGDLSSAVLSINVIGDDQPELQRPANEIVDESNLDIVESGQLVANFGNDDPGAFTGNGVFGSTGSRTGNTLSHKGTNIDVTFANGVYTGKAGSVTVFTLSIAANGNYTYRQLETLDHANRFDPNDIINLNFGVRVQDGDGDTADSILTVQVKDDAPVAVNDGRSVADNATVTGNVITNDDQGNDLSGKITHIQFENGSVVSIPSTGRVINGDHGTLTIQQNGSFSYKASNNNTGGVDQFTYTLADFDGDTDTATLSITVGADNIPVFGTPASEIVDETNLNITETGRFAANFGNDGPGTFLGNGSFSAGGSLKGNSLSHEGTNIAVTFANGVYTGKAGSKTIFTLTIESDGDYTYRQFHSLDHKDANNANDIITLNFGVRARDADGDFVNRNLTVNVKDDAPKAANDFVGNVLGTVSGGAGPATPFDSVLKNDNRSNDEPNEITKISFGNVTKDVPSTSGKVSIKGATGTLSINKWGGWEFVQDSVETWRGTERPAGTNVFTYTLRDGDGDISTATFTIVTKYQFIPRDNDDRGGDTPLVLDLDHDGIELVSLKDGVFFDLGPDGELDKTGWVAADDGFLALDANKDGIINDHSELFGLRGVDGFSILSQYDSNEDGIIDANDDVFQDLLIWQDANQNGYSEASELLGLASYEIKSIDLTANTSDQIIAGNDIILDGRFTYEDGSEGDIVDAVFDSVALDILYGTEAADTFIFDAINDNPVAIRDFNIEEGDALDLSALIESSDNIDSAIKSFVYADQQGDNTVVSINTNGESHAIAILEGVTGVSVDDLVKQTMVA